MKTRCLCALVLMSFSITSLSRADSPAQLTHRPCHGTLDFRITASGTRHLVTRIRSPWLWERRRRIRRTPATHSSWHTWVCTSSHQRINPRKHSTIVIANGVYPERKKMGKRSNIYGFATDPYRGGLFVAGHRANDQLLPGEELEENMRPVYSNNKILIT